MAATITLNFTTVTLAGWVEVTSSTTIQHDLDGGDGPLYLWTNTSLGSNNEIILSLDPGKFRVKFAASQYEYKIEHCTHDCYGSESTDG